MRLLITAGVLGAFALFMFIQNFKNRNDGQTRTFFYDVSEKKIFAAPSTLVPPIKGLNDAEEDAFRAVVISTNNRPHDKKTWKVAYLEKYSDELKRQFESAQHSGGSPQMGRAEGQSHRFVRRVDDAQWHPMNSPEAGVILNEWLTAGPNGGEATICTP